MEICCVAVPDTGADRRSGKRAAIVTSARRACCRSRIRPATSWASRSARIPASPRTRSRTAWLMTSSKRDMCTPRRVGPSSTKHSSRAENSCGERRSTPMWMTFSTPVSPTRDSDMRTDGSAAWTSTGSVEDDGLGSMTPRRTLAVRAASIAPSSTTGCPVTPASDRTEALPERRTPLTGRSRVLGRAARTSAAAL
jgi:hypothetical protein